MATRPGIINGMFAIGSGVRCTVLGMTFRWIFIGHHLDVERVMNRHDFFPTGEGAAVPGRVISLHQVLGSELGMVVDTDNAGIEGACSVWTVC